MHCNRILSSKMLSQFEGCKAPVNNEDAIVFCLVSIP